MKCLCGYEFDQSKEHTNENEPFIRVTGSTFKRRFSYGMEEEIFLYVCPKCSTVKMDRW